MYPKGVQGDIQLWKEFLYIKKSTKKINMLLICDA